MASSILAHPLEQTCEELHEAGFLIERLLEPRPTEQAAAINHEKYERLNREPTGFLAIRAVPHPRRYSTVTAANNQLPLPSHDYRSDDFPTSTTNSPFR